MLRSLLRPACVLAWLAFTGAVGGCGAIATLDADHSSMRGGDAIATRGAPAWDETIVVQAHLEEGDGPYLLDTGDRLRIFVYAQPNLSRLYTVDHDGQIAVPLIGTVQARGHTTRGLAKLIATKLGAQYVREPQVTVDIAQNRPFYILGEVRSAGQYPYASGMTVQAAVAMAGGYADRANERRIQITRRHNGTIEKMDVPPDYLVRPGDTIYVYERWL